LGAIYNFIPQARADQLGLEAAQKRKPPLPIATVNGKQLHATAVIRQIVHMQDSAETKQSHAINFVIANIAH
jgi:hypothetical protein